MKKIFLVLLINCWFCNTALFDNIDKLTKDKESLINENSDYIDHIKNVSKKFFQDKNVLEILRKIYKQVEDSSDGIIQFVFDKESKVEKVCGVRKILGENHYFTNKLIREICNYDDLSFYHFKKIGKNAPFVLIVLKDNASFSFIFNANDNLNLKFIEIPVNVIKEGDKYIMHSKYRINF